MRRVIWCRLWSRTCFPWWWSSSTGPCLPPLGPRLPRPKSPPPRRPSTKQTLWETEHFKCVIRDLKLHAWKLFDTSKTDYVFRAVVVSQLVSWSIFISGILLKHEASPKKCKRRKTPKVHAALHFTVTIFVQLIKVPISCSLGQFWIEFKSNRLHIQLLKLMMSHGTLIILGGRLLSIGRIRYKCPCISSPFVHLVTPLTSICPFPKYVVNWHCIIRHGKSSHHS